MVDGKLNKMGIKQMSIEQLRIISNNFAQELRDASDGKINSLCFIVHEISQSSIVKDGETFQALAIGGTVGKIAILKKTGNTVRIIDEKEEQLLLKTEEEFLDFINRKLLANINVLALNLAQSLKPIFKNGRLDGILLEVSKEGKFRGLIGKRIGQEIENYVLAKRNKKIKVAVANDTVCLLTSGLEKFREEELAGGIVGTGLNFAFFLSKNKLVNLESGNFDNFPQTETGKEVDKESSQSGSYLFEKETAGAYLYKHFNFILKENNIDHSVLASTEELNRVSCTNIPQISEIAQSLIKRSAQLVACQIAGIIAFKKTNMVFNMEGSLFWKGNNYKETVKKTVMQLVPKHRINFVEIENSAILGATKLVI